VVVDAAHPQGQRLVFGSERDLRRGVLELSQRDVTVLPAEATVREVQGAATRLIDGPPLVTIRGIERRLGQRTFPAGIDVEQIEVMRGQIRARENELRVLTEQGAAARGGRGLLPSGRRWPMRGRRFQLSRLNSPLNQSIRAKQQQLDNLRQGLAELTAPQDVGLDIAGVIREEPFSVGRRRTGLVPESRMLAEPFTRPVRDPSLGGQFRQTIRQEPIQAVDRPTVAPAIGAEITPQGIRAVPFDSASLVAGERMRGSIRRNGMDDTITTMNTAAARAETDVLQSNVISPPAHAVGVPAGPNMPPPRQSHHALTDDMDLPTWETPSQGIMRKWESARQAQGFDTLRWFEEGSRLAKEAGVAFNEETINPLYRALHGEIPLSEVDQRLHPLFNFIKEFQQIEEREMLEFLSSAKNTAPEFLRLDAENFATRMIAHPDYFPRGWQRGARGGGGGFPAGPVRTPGFTKPRIDMTYSEIRAFGENPSTWNPLAMMAERRLAGMEYRESVVLMNRLHKEGLARTSDEVLGSTGWRVPRIGPTFQGRPAPTPISSVRGGGDQALTGAIFVPNRVANILERVYAPTMSDTMRKIRWFSNGFKGAKLAGSLFQHVDMTTRAVGSGLTPTGLARGAPLRYPSLFKDIVTTQASRKARANMERQLLSNERVHKDFDLTYRMLVEEGLNLQADTSIIQREFLNFLGEEPKRIFPIQKLKDLNDWWQSGLFDGVYRSTQKWSLENFIIPQIRRTRPDATARQVAAEAAEAANIIFSTPGRWQTIINDPALRTFMENVFFSINENESLLRLGARAIGTSAGGGLAREQVLGTLAAMAVIGNGINFAATGSPLPKEAYFPIDLQNPYAMFGFGYQNKFLSPIFPGITGSAGQAIHVDIMGQMDTPFRIADPFAFIGARVNVPYRAIINQITGESFGGQQLDTPLKRITQLALDLFGPIGATSGLGAVTEQVPELQTAIPRGEHRLGRAGQLLQLSGVNLRSQTVDSIARSSGSFNFDSLPDVLPPNAGRGALSKSSVRLRIARVLNGTVISDPLFPSLKNTTPVAIRKFEETRGLR